MSYPFTESDKLLWLHKMREADIRTIERAKTKAWCKWMVFGVITPAILFYVGKSELAWGLIYIFLSVYWDERKGRYAFS